MDSERALEATRSLGHSLNLFVQLNDDWLTATGAPGWVCLPGREDTDEVSSQ